MIKVAFVAARLKTGGAERQWLELIQGMDRTRFGIVLICMYELDEIGKEIEALGVRSYSGLFKTRFSAGGMRPFAEILKKEKIDVLFLWNQPLTMLYGIAAARMAGVQRKVAVIHTTGYLERKVRASLINRVFMRFLDKVVALGEGHKDYIVRHERVSSEKVAVIFNGVDIHTYGSLKDKRRKKEELGLAPDAKIVGIVARLHKVKRHDIFLKAAKEAKEKYGNVQFVIVGDGDERGKIQAMIAQLGLGDSVKMLGTRRDIPEINGVFDVAVMSSETEAMPMSVIEAMASSVPVIATKVGSVPDLVKDGENGFLVDSGDAGAVAKNLLRLLQDEALASRMGQSGRRMAEEKFSREAMVKAYEALFEAECRAKASS